jgi:large subunit ribosomal protein L17
MRHRKKDKKLNRSYSLRKATLRDIAKSVILHQSVKTTLVKAKEARRLVDRLITLGKRGDIYSRRMAYRELCDHRSVTVLFNDISPRFSKINGGYTRILPWVNRRGDNAQLVILELTLKKQEDKPKRLKSEEKGSVKQRPESIQKESTEIKKEAVQKKPIKETPKEKIKPEKDIGQPKKEEPKKIEKPPQKKFFKGLRDLFKKERDSK